jgi:hypothetical protein
MTVIGTARMIRVPRRLSAPGWFAGKGSLTPSSEAHV